MVVTFIVTMVYEPPYNWGASPCTCHHLWFEYGPVANYPQIILVGYNMYRTNKTKDIFATSDSCDEPRSRDIYSNP